MILLLLLSICAIFDGKPLTTIPSVHTHPDDGNTTTSDDRKEPLVVDFEDISAAVSPQPITNFHIDFANENGTEIIGRRRTIFEVIPADYLCDFCKAIIDKLKYRQKTEGEDFEKNMKEECWKHNGTDCDDGNVCELINKVNLERLRDDNTVKICVDEKMCPDDEKELQKIKAAEEKNKEEEARIKQEEEQLKREEEIEHIKSEATKLEYEKQKQEQARRKAEEARINTVHSKTGDVEYVVDEVAKEEDDKNDYLDHAPVNADPVAGQVTVHSGSVKGNTSNNTKTKPPVYNAGFRDQAAKAPTGVQKLPHGRISGSAGISPNGQLYLDRTVQLKLDVDDLRK